MTFLIPLVACHLVSHLNVLKIKLVPACNFPVNLVIFLKKEVGSWQGKAFCSGCLEVSCVLHCHYLVWKNVEKPSALGFSSRDDPKALFCSVNHRKCGKKMGYYSFRTKPESDKQLLL